MLWIDHVACQHGVKRHARKMIEHHKGALTMSEVALKETDDAMVRKMAKATIDMQTKDITELQKWLTDRGSAKQ